MKRVFFIVSVWLCLLSMNAFTASLTIEGGKNASDQGAKDVEKDLDAGRESREQAIAEGIEKVVVPVVKSIQKALEEGGGSGGGSYTDSSSFGSSSRGGASSSGSSTPKGVKSIGNAGNTKVNGQNYQTYSVQCHSGRSANAYMRDGKWYYQVGEMGSRFNNKSVEAMAEDYCR